MRRRRRQGFTNLSTRDQLSDFLASVERRAYKHARFAVRDDHAALDIVQDAMLKLSERYGDKPAEEFPMLFHRILQNTILDHFRRQKVRSHWLPLFSSLTSKHAEEEFDPLELLEDKDNSSQAAQPDAALEQTQVMAAIEEVLNRLPPRQREAFLLRYWEQLDTTETAEVMGCSEGSVKTHCSRATHAMAAMLKEKGIDLSWDSN